MGWILVLVVIAIVATLVGVFFKDIKGWYSRKLTSPFEALANALKGTKWQTKNGLITIQFDDDLDKTSGKLGMTWKVSGGTFTGKYTDRYKNQEKTDFELGKMIFDPINAGDAFAKAVLNTDKPDGKEIKFATNILQNPASGLFLAVQTYNMFLDMHDKDDDSKSTFMFELSNPPTPTP